MCPPYFLIFVFSFLSSCNLLFFNEIVNALEPKPTQKIVFGISKLVKQISIFSLQAKQLWVFFSGNGKQTNTKKL